MRILALHGHGTSAYIFKSQTVAFRSKLPRTITFDFVDAPWPCAAAPGVRALFDSGNYTWWPRPTTDSVRAAAHWLAEYLAEHGPYDAVMGFSQGCSLIGSFLLYHAREQQQQQQQQQQQHQQGPQPQEEEPEPEPLAPLPFRAAIFICGGLPLNVLSDLGVSVPQRAHDINDETVRLLKQKAGMLSELAQNVDRIRPGVGLWDDTAALLHDPGVMPQERDVFGLDFTAMPADLRIRIPTVHVYGAKDPRWPASVQLAHFCDKDKRKMYDHGGGHDIPRSTEVSKRIAELVMQLSKEI